MLGALVRVLLLIVILVAVGAFLLGWWGRGPDGEADRPVATTGEEAPRVDTDRAREVGAEVGERTAAAADQAREALAEGGLTAKIKAKMALDDTVKALDIDVDTEGSTVTLSGVVATGAQRERALQLARETEGVTNVVDRIRVRQ